MMTHKWEYAEDGALIVHWPPKTQTEKRIWRQVEESCAKADAGRKLPPAPTSLGFYIFIGLFIVWGSVPFWGLFWQLYKIIA